MVSYWTMTTIFYPPATTRGAQGNGRTSRVAPLGRPARQHTRTTAVALRAGGVASVRRRRAPPDQTRTARASRHASAGDLIRGACIELRPGLKWRSAQRIPGALHMWKWTTILPFPKMLEFPSSGLRRSGSRVIPFGATNKSRRIS